MELVLSVVIQATSLVTSKGYHNKCLYEEKWLDDWGRIRGYTWEREAQQLKGEVERFDPWGFFSWPQYNLFNFLLLEYCIFTFKYYTLVTYIFLQMLIIFFWYFMPQIMLIA